MIFSILALLLIIGGLVFVYIQYRKTLTNENINLIDIDIFVKANDVKTDEQIETDFVVVQNEQILYTGKTQKEGLEEINIKINKNSTMPYFMNYGGEYYSNAGGYSGGKNFNMVLYKGGEPDVTLIFSNESKYILNVSTGDFQYRQIGFCLKWSFNYLNIHSNYDILTENPSRFSSYDVCYYTLKTLDFYQSMQIELDYELLNNLIVNDYVEVAIFDSNQDYTRKYVIENINNEDVGMGDVIFKI